VSDDRKAAVSAARGGLGGELYREEFFGLLIAEGAIKDSFDVAAVAVAACVEVESRLSEPALEAELRAHLDLGYFDVAGREAL